MPCSICLHQCLWGDLTKFCGPFKSIYSSADSSLSLHSSINYAHSLIPSFNPLTTICSLLPFYLFLSLLQQSLPLFTPLRHSLYSSPSLIPHGIYLILLSFLPYLCHHPSSVAPSLIYPLSVSFLLSPTFHPKCPSPHLSLILAAFLSQGEVNRDRFLPVTSQTSPETKNGSSKRL